MHAASVGLVLITRTGSDTGRCGCSPVRPYSHHGVISTAGVYKPCTPHSFLGLRELCHPAQALPPPAPPLVVPEKGACMASLRGGPCLSNTLLVQGEAKDLLFISTERYKFCVLEWDSRTGAPHPLPAHTHAQPVPAVCPQQPQRCGSQAQARQAPKLHLLTTFFCDF